MIDEDREPSQAYPEREVQLIRFAHSARATRTLLPTMNQRKCNRYVCFTIGIALAYQ